MDASSVTKLVIRALEDRVSPWAAKFHGFPTNVATRLRYDGVNVLLLQIAGRKSYLWGTAEQWAVQGGKIKSGEDPVEIYNSDFCGKILQRRMLVFNMDQISGLRNPLTGRDYAVAESLVAGTKAKVQHKDTMEAAYYYPPLDYIQFPFREKLVADFYYYYLFHELGHWTEPRLNWSHPQREIVRDLRAEMVAGFLSSEVGIPGPPLAENSTYCKYVNQWIAMMKKDSNFVFKVTQEAIQAVDYIVSLTYKVEPRHRDL